MSQPKSLTLDGKRYRINPLIPMGDIEWYVRQWVHVSATDEEVREEIRDICAKRPGWTRTKIAQAEVVALRQHRRNQELHMAVTQGFSRTKTA